MESCDGINYIMSIRKRADNNFYGRIAINKILNYFYEK